MDIKVGLLFSLTGTMSVTEEGQYKAALLAINEINENGGILGRRLTPVLRDTCSDPFIAARKAEELLNEGIHLLVGLYTSASRKSTLPALDKNDCLLFYPTQYEGGEQHPNIIYCGPLPNQLLLNYIPWITENLGKKFYLIGSDYIYPRSINKLIHQLVKANRGSIVKESYFSLGQNKFHYETEQIKQNKPDVIFSTLVGGSALSFYKACYEEKVNIPIASTITAETEVCAIDSRYMIGHYSCFPYFNSIHTKENIFLKKKFIASFGADSISSAMENAYNSIHLLAEAISKAKSLDIPLIKRSLFGLKYQAPQGEVIVDAYNQHLWLNARIGQVIKDGTFKILWESEAPIRPLPFSLKTENIIKGNKYIEESLAKNSRLIHELKKATSFFPYKLAFFDSDGIMLDLFDPSLKDNLPPNFELGLSTWTTKFLKHSGITKSFLKEEVAFSIGSEHKDPLLADWITVGIPINYKNKLYGVMGVFVENISEFQLDLFSTLVNAFNITTQHIVDNFEKTKESIFLYELLHDISNHFDEALLVKKGTKILFKNNKAEKLINERDDILLSIYQENFDDITHVKKQSLRNQSNKSFQVRIIPVHDYRYIYIGECKLNQRNSFPKQKAPLLLRNIIGKNISFLDAITQAQTASTNSANVLLLGESGTGKEVFARAIHNESARKNSPFVAINCAAINESLIASELFGYVEGAFTGAKKGGSPGKFEQANGGTLFLDEIGDMPADLQATLLRVLQEKEITRVGGNDTIPIDVRIIAATNKNLSQEIAYKGSFRGDLYYRLNVFTIELIPLRDRKDDIQDLATHFLLDIATKESGTIKSISYEALHCLQNYDWPGNIRELRNVIERAYYLSDFGSDILVEHLPRHLYYPSVKNKIETITTVHDIKQKNDVQQREDILNTLIKCKGNISKSSQELGISRNTLYKKIKEYNLNF